jgi:sarcosine oxidase
MTPTIPTASVVVVGGGVMGAWTALWLRRRGVKVVLVDRYGIGNTLASSTDETRVTRSGHGLDEFYPRWQRLALEQWTDLESSSGCAVFIPTGVVWLASAEDGIERDSAVTLERLGIPVEVWRLDEVTRRYPQIRPEGLEWALWEPEAGALAARAGVIAVGERLRAEGVATIHASCVPLPATHDGRLDHVVLSDGKRVTGDAFVFACGAWLPGLFPEVLGSFISVTRQEVLHLATPPGVSGFDADELPVWIDSSSVIYGVPSIWGGGFKLAPDWPGPASDPDSMDRRISERIVEDVRAFARRRFPAVAELPVVASRVCQYESTPDTHFVIDRHPDLENAWLVGGGSGHGYKHGPVIGEYVAALVTGDSQRVGALAPPDLRFALPPARSHSGTSGAATSRHASPV